MPEMQLPFLNGGLNLTDLEHKINDNQSPSMMNLWFKDRTLSKRMGQEYVALTISDAPAVLGTIYGISPFYEGFVCIHAGTKLYKWNTTTNALTELGTVAAAVSVFLEFNATLYHIDGAELMQINASWEISTVTPYTPTTFINCAPDLSSSDENEAFNLLGSGFAVQYNGDGASTVYALPLSELDATVVTVSIAGVAKTEVIHFTVDRTAGTVNFSAGTSPHGAPDEGLNNVVITAHKTISGNKDRIVKCTIAVPFGGESTSITGGTRAFLMGNPDYPRTYWYSDLGAGQSYGMAYFPDTQFEEIIQNNEKIMAVGKQAGKLVIFKERSIFTVDYQFDGTEVFYPLKEVSANLGCNVPKSVQLIDNSLVFANTYGGVFILINMTGSAEENVRPISANVNGTRINPGLMHENNLDLATSLDYDRKYWLCVNGTVYMWDYDITPYATSTRYGEVQRRLSWFRLNNITAAHWYAGESLYYATGTKLVKFVSALNDFGNPILARWKSKSFDFGRPNYEKRISNIHASIRADTSTSMTINALDENKVTKFTYPIKAITFRFDTFRFDVFSFFVQRYSKPYRIKPRLKRIVYLQIEAIGGEINRDMSLTDLVIGYEIDRMVKR